MAYLTVDEQTEAIIQVGIIGLGISRADVEAAIDSCDGDRLALNRLRVKWNARHRSACAQINRASDDKQADARAALARVKHDETLEEAARERRHQRQRQTPGARIDKALAALNAMSTVRAVVGRDPDLADVKAPKTAESCAPGFTDRDGLVDGQVNVAPILAGIAYLTEQLEATLDAVRGVAPPHELAKLSGDVKDHVILTQLVGVHANDIAAAAPWLGSGRTIRLIRSEHGQRIDGTPKPAARLTA